MRTDVDKTAFDQMSNTPVQKSSRSKIRATKPGKSALRSEEKSVPDKPARSGRTPFLLGQDTVVFWSR